MLSFYNRDILCGCNSYNNAIYTGSHISMISDWWHRLHNMNILCFDKLIYIFNVSGEAVILSRRCLYRHFSMIDNCTNDKRLIQKYLSTSFASTGYHRFKVNTARGTVCVCRTDICNNAPLRNSKKSFSNTNKIPKISDMLEGDTSVINDFTYSIFSPTNSSLDFVSVEEVVTEYWKKLHRCPRYLSTNQHCWQSKNTRPRSGTSQI